MVREFILNLLFDFLFFLFSSFLFWLFALSNRYQVLILRSRLYFLDTLSTYLCILQTASLLNTFRYLTTHLHIFFLLLTSAKTMFQFQFLTQPFLHFTSFRTASIQPEIYNLPCASFYTGGSSVVERVLKIRILGIEGKIGM